MSKNIRITAIIMVLLIFCTATNIYAYVESTPFDDEGKGLSKPRYWEPTIKAAEQGDVVLVSVKGLSEFNYFMYSVVAEPVIFAVDTLELMSMLTGGTSSATLIKFFILGKITEVAFDKAKNLSREIANDPPDFDYKQGVLLHPHEIFEPLNNSLFMQARADYLTKISEHNSYLQAILVSLERMQGAQIIDEPDYIYAQTVLLKHYNNLLKENYFEQKKLIKQQAAELHNYYTKEELIAEATHWLNNYTSYGLEIEEKAILIEAGLSEEEIETIEALLLSTAKKLIDEGNLLESIESGFQEQEKAIDEITSILAATLNEIDEYLDAFSDYELVPGLLLGFNGIGGGICIAENSSAIFTDNKIYDNSANFGGAIAVYDKSSVTLDNNILRFNNAAWGGSLFANYHALVNTNTNQFGYNHANRDGGAMWICRDSTLNQEEPDNNIYSNNLPDIIFLDGITIKEKLIKVDADPLKGYYWPYYLFIPSEVNETEQINLMIGPNNTGIGHNNFKVHDDNAYFEASSGWKSQIARKTGVPLLVPVFPRPYTEWQYYTHSLNREVMLLRSGKLARLDLQLIAMIEDAQEKLSDLGVNTERKVFMVGYSACGTFSQRFTILHPHLVRAIAAGGINAITTFPVADWNGERLRYAVGIADFEEITGNKFNMDEYIKVPQFLYMGSIDNNDTTLYDDAYERRDAHLIWRFTSRDMPARWEKCENIFYELGIHNARFKTYEGVGHQLTHEMINDVVLFFKENSGE